MKKYPFTTLEYLANLGSWIWKKRIAILVAVLWSVSLLGAKWHYDLNARKAREFTRLTTQLEKLVYQKELQVRALELDAQIRNPQPKPKE